MNRQKLHVTVVYAPQARQVHEVTLTLDSSSTVGDAVVCSGFAADLSTLATQNLQIGVWGRKVPWEHRLRDGDRVELYRGLRVDPKVARRERFVKQGARTAGLFAKKRPAVN